MLLLERYVQQARELQTLAGPSDEIRVARCEDAGPLLQVLGYRLRNACGQKDVSLAALDPENAFLTIDSGFPLDPARAGAVRPTRRSPTPMCLPVVPVLLRQSDWTSMNTWTRSRAARICSTYFCTIHKWLVCIGHFPESIPKPGLPYRSPGLWNLLPYAGVLDFYGTQICIRSRKVLVPGGTAAEPAWKDLVGASPGIAGRFRHAPGGAGPRLAGCVF